MNYKIIFNFKESVAFAGFRPTFDGILAACFVRDRLGELPAPLEIKTEDMIDFSEMPVVRHEKGYFNSSILFLGKETQWIDNWRKRWRETFDHTVDFEGKVRKINITSESYKAYDVSLVLHSLENNQAFSFFESDNFDEVYRLLSEHLFAIGKKRNVGHGMLDPECRFQIIKWNEPLDYLSLRPVPIEFLSEDELFSQGHVKIQYCSWKPPYWLPKNMKKCVYPNIS